MFQRLRRKTKDQKLKTDASDTKNTVASSKVVLARFEARDGTGLWEVGPDGVWVNNVFYLFSDTSSIICRAEQGRSYTSTTVVEDHDNFALFAALAVYQETHNVELAGLAAWALSDSTTSTKIERHVIPGTIQLSLNGMSRNGNSAISLRYREDGQYLQVGAVQHFADITHTAIRAYRQSRGTL